MKHSKSSQLFRAYCAQIPQHRMHVFGRLLVTMYLDRRYATAKTHSALLAVALEHMDQQLWLVNNQGVAA